MNLRRLPAPCTLALFLVADVLAPQARAADADFLDVDMAFQVQIAPDSDKAVSIRLAAAPGYHLYRDRFAVEARPPVVLPPAELPGGKTEFDANFKFLFAVECENGDVWSREWITLDHLVVDFWRYVFIHDSMRSLPL